MANDIRIKRSSVALKFPTAGQLVEGELAINTTDKRLYSRDGAAVFQVFDGVYATSGHNHSGVYQPTDDPTFTGSFTLSDIAPILNITDTDATVDEGKWHITAESDKLIFRTINDADTLFTAYLEVVRTGANVTSVNVLSSDFDVDGDVTGNNLNVANWDLAHGWGDHDLVGYLTSETSHADVLVDADIGVNVQAYDADLTFGDVAEFISSQWEFRDGIKVSGFSSNHAVFDHDATDLDTIFTGTTDWNVVGLPGNFWLRDGAGLKISDALDADDLTMSADGAAFNFVYTNIGNVAATGASSYSYDANLFLDSAALLVVRDSDNDSYATLGADGTDFAIAGTNITDLNITGFARLDVAGWVRMTHTTPLFELRETDAAANEGNWDFASVAGQFRMRAVNDADSSWITFLSADRTGTDVTSVNIVNSDFAVGGDMSTTGELRFGSTTSDKLLLYGTTGTGAEATDSFIGISSGTVYFNTPSSAHYDFRCNNVDILTIASNRITLNEDVNMQNGFHVQGSVQDVGNTSVEFFGGVIGGNPAMGAYNWDSAVYVPFVMYGQPIHLKHNTVTKLLTASLGISVIGHLDTTLSVIAAGAVTDVGQVGVFAYMDVSGGSGRIGAYNYDSPGYQPLEIRGTNVFIDCGGTFDVDATGSAATMLAGSWSFTGHVTFTNSLIWTGANTVCGYDAVSSSFSYDSDTIAHYGISTYSDSVLGGVTLAMSGYYGNRWFVTGVSRGYVDSTAWNFELPVIVPASVTGAASLNVPHGTAPTSPVDGDMWTTTAGLYVRINGSTVGPLS